MLSQPASSGPALPVARRLPAVAGLLLLVLGNPLAWRGESPGLWFPSAGLALCLVAWAGPGAAVLAFKAALLAAALALAAGAAPFGRSGWPALPLALWEAVLEAGEPLAAWWCYRRLAGGSRGLADPRSATLFLLVVPCLVVGLFSAVRPLPLGLTAGGPSWHLVAEFWLSRAVGVLALAPPLLVNLTPWLVRAGLAAPEPASSA